MLLLRYKDEARHYGRLLQLQADVSSIRITSGRPMKTKHSSANTNQNNHNEANKRGKKSNQAFNMNEIRREVMMLLDFVN